MNKKRDKEAAGPASEASGKVNIVAQELKFAKMLASNDVKIRSGVLKSLKKWLNTRSQSSYQFTNSDFLRLWKGLYYCMWMSDKPLVQEELSEELGSLIHCFPNIKIGIQFYKNFLETMCLEWFGIDQWRLDKFMMLVRRVTRQMLFALKNAEWDEESLKLFSDAFNKTVFQTSKCPKGLILHICDFYIEEIAKVADGELSEERAYLLIEPFLEYYTKLSDQLLLKHVQKTIFHQLLFQSELGQSYQEKFDIWKQANFPTKHIDDLEIKYQVRGNKSFGDDEQSDGEDRDENERPLDPRAGRVNVELSEIKFDALKLAEVCENLRYKQFATSKSRKGLATMASQFRKFANDIFPLGIHKMPQPFEDGESTIDLDLKAMELAEFQKKLAIGDVDSESSDFDEDLDNRKHGTLKRKNKDTSNKIKEKKQKLSKLHNERFFKAAEDFTKDNSQRDDEEVESADEQQNEMKIKKKKKKSMKESKEELPRKIKLQKRKSLPAQLKGDDFEANESGLSEKPKKALKLSTEPFKVTDEWSEPLKKGEIEFFVPSHKQKLKALQKASDETLKKSSSLLLNPFAKSQSGKSAADTTPRIQQDKDKKTNSGKRVKIALNKNKAQSPHEYIKQVKESPNLPTAYLSKKPTKSVLKPNTLPSPINPFYQKKIGLKLNFNETI